MDYRGRHVTADIWLHSMPSAHTLMEQCEAAIAASGMQVVAALHKMFEPAGLTAVWVLAESHFTLHTYPEHHYISVDCYTCGSEGDPAKAVAKLLSMLPVAQQQVQEHARGVQGSAPQARQFQPLVWPVHRALAASKKPGA